MGNNEAFTARKKELVIEHRTTALRIARSLLRRWNLFLDLAETQSLADIALCEAVRGFDESRGTRFITYLFPYIKGVLINELKSIQKDRQYRSSPLPEGSSYDECSSEVELSHGIHNENVSDESSSPEYLTYRKELQNICSVALKTLLPLEREALIGVDVMDDKVAELARRIGYSRPYLSSVRTRAISKMQPLFELLAA